MFSLQKIYDRSNISALSLTMSRISERVVIASKLWQLGQQFLLMIGQVKIMNSVEIRVDIQSNSASSHDK